MKYLVTCLLFLMLMGCDGNDGSYRSYIISQQQEVPHEAPQDMEQE